MATFSIIKNKIYKDDKLFKEFINDIYEFKIYENHIYIIIYPEGNNINNNLECYDFMGKLKWKVNEKIYPNVFCPVENVYLINNKLFIYRKCGIEEEVNILNGEILSSELIK